MSDPIYTYELHYQGETYSIFADESYVEPRELCERLNILEQRLEELVWLLEHEPPDDLGMLTQTLRKKWNSRRDKALA